MHSVSAQSTDTGGDRQGDAQLSTSSMYRYMSKLHMHIIHVYSVTTQSTDTGDGRQGYDRQRLAQLSTSGMYKCLSKTYYYYYYIIIHFIHDYSVFSIDY